MVEVHVIAAVRPANQRIVQHLAACLLYREAEGTIHGALDNHPVPGLGQGQQGQADARHHAGDHHDILPGEGHLVPPCPEVNQRLIIVRLGLGVAVGAVGRPGQQRLLHRRGAGEVHVRHPQGQDVAALPLAQLVPLLAASAHAIDAFVKVLFGKCHGSAFLLQGFPGAQYPETAGFFEDVHLSKQGFQVLEAAFRPLLLANHQA